MELPYEQFFEAMPCYLTVQDRELRIVQANLRFRQDFGEVEGRHCYQVYKRRAEKCEACPVERTFRDGQPRQSEERLKTLEGREISAQVNTMPIRDETGRIVAVMEMSTDITEHTLLEQQLRESQARYHLLFEEVPCYISIQDRDLRVLDANRQFREEFGEFLGCKCYRVYKHRSKACIPCPVQQTFQDGQTHQSEEVVASRTGEPINVLVTAAPIRDSQGAIQSVMEMSANITQIRQLQSQLASIGLLVGSISHSIKGLLTGLDGGIYMVSTGMERSDRPRLEKGWNMVLRNVDRIRGMVLDILHYAKEREPNWESLSAPEVAKDVCGLMEPKVRKQGVAFRQDLDPNAGQFEADAKAIRSLLINLIDNSLDACWMDGKKNSHQVCVGLKGFPDHVEFEIQDNGIGMDQETREKAFTLFFSSKGGEGTGLGLFIANRIAQAHGGSIHLESEFGQGARFRVHMPRRRPAQSRPAAPAA